MNPYPASIPRSIYPGLNGEGHPWPLPDGAVVQILDRHGSPVEGARVQLVRPGERVRWSPSPGIEISGVLR